MNKAFGNKLLQETKLVRYNYPEKLIHFPILYFLKEFYTPYTTEICLWSIYLLLP